MRWICYVLFDVVFAYWQTDYRFIPERISVDFVNKSYISDFNYSIYHFSRYERRLNMSGTFLQDLGNDTTTVVRAYKFQSNEYRDFPFYYEQNCCDIWKSDMFGTNPAHFDTNMKPCPVKQGHYYIRGVHMDDRKLPPFAPRGRYMVESAGYHKKMLLAKGKMYFKIEPTNPLEKIID